MAAPMTESRPDELAIPWGEHDRLVLAFPPDWPPAEVVWPDLGGAIGDYPSALERALDAPDGCPRIEAQVGPGTTVAIVVDDPSRRTPVREALPILLRRLHEAGVRPDDVTVSVGVGRHRAVSVEAMRRRVGGAIVDAYRCFSPPVDDPSAYLDLGEAPEGVPVRVFRPVAEAGLRILIGSVLPHLQAGFGGGYKLIFPGTSHRSTLGALHRQGLDGDAGRLLGGDAADNPMRRAIRMAAGRLGPCASLSHLLGAPGQILDVAAGHPDPVQDRLAAGARRRFEAPDAAPADLIVAGNHPWPGDPMQSFKVLLQHRAASRPGGALVGLFWTEAGEIDRSFPMPALRLVAASGALGGWTIRRGVALASRVVSALGRPAAFLLRWARELVVDRTVLIYAPPLHARLGDRLGPIRLFADQHRLWRAAAEALGDPSRARLRIFPQAGLTYAPQRQGHPVIQDAGRLNIGIR
ncbi:MAG TPA: lactate racemase domain-containing protein [Isosphaeraceae bacterium]|nr:lactate racemase domain-containing protein [Isosphaeraceae bacterium]